MAAEEPGRNRTVKHRIAATAATAAFALSGPAVAARPASARIPAPTRDGPDPPARLAAAEGPAIDAALDASRRREMAAHRQRLAGALAAELGDRGASRIERALATADAEIGDAYSRGERPHFVAGLPAGLASASGRSGDELAAAFEAMARNARERVRGNGRSG